MEDGGRSEESWFHRAITSVLGRGDSALDQGLEVINDRLGLNPASQAPAHRSTRSATTYATQPTESMARSIYYAPDMDGQADPGEVVWIWVNTDGPGSPARERAIIVIGRSRQHMLGLVISPNPEHAEEDNWLGIGSGPWDESGRQCWVRMDKVLEIPELEIRRQGAVIPRHRFERIANRLRSSYGWG
ncbi:type II toxin-antitoxin system PemK/MazF family toxin [Corynebacterium meridianum]|uniref:type II toxin-antitoxin system PemK/MazF family toxin n=1 Tax=Corynebacterium meridianum TaxID=2765363 RepID=UPI00300D0EE7